MSEDRKGRLAGQGIRRRLGEGIETRIFSGENVMLSVVRFEPNAVGKPHSHPEEQWGLLLEGSCVRTQGGEEIELGEGDFWHSPSGLRHGMRAGAEGALILDIFSPPRPEYLKEGEGFGG